MGLMGFITNTFDTNFIINYWSSLNDSFILFYDNVKYFYSLLPICKIFIQDMGFLNILFIEVNYAIYLLEVFYADNSLIDIFLFFISGFLLFLKFLLDVIILALGHLLVLPYKFVDFLCIFSEFSINLQDKIVVQLNSLVLELVGDFCIFCFYETICDKISLMFNGDSLVGSINKYLSPYIY